MKPPLDWRDLFRGDDGTASQIRINSFLAVLVCLWVIVHMEMRDATMPELVIGVLGIIVGGHVFIRSKWSGKPEGFRDAGPEKTRAQVKNDAGGE